MPVRNLSRRERRVVCETIQLTGAGAGAVTAGGERAAVFKLNRVLRTHPGVLHRALSCATGGTGTTGAAASSSAAGASPTVDLSTTPRCVLVSQPSSGTLMARCTYTIDPSVPEPLVSSVRSGVLVKLREALLVHEGDEEEEELEEEEGEVTAAADKYFEQLAVELDEGEATTAAAADDYLRDKQLEELRWIERVEKELNREHGDDDDDTSETPAAAAAAATAGEEEEVELDGEIDLGSSYEQYERLFTTFRDDTIRRHRLAPKEDVEEEKKKGGAEEEEEVEVEEEEEEEQQKTPENGTATTKTKPGDEENGKAAVGRMKEEEKDLKEERGRRLRRYTACTAL